MNKFKKNLLVTVTTLVISFLLTLVSPIAALAAGPAPVNLGSSGNFAILSKAGITNTGSHTSVITGNIGSSPITAAAMNNVWCSEVTGIIYGVDAAYVGSGTTTCFLGGGVNKTLVDNAVLDMGTAYTDAAGRTLPTGTNLYGGNLGGRTFAPGLYKWTTGVTIPTNVTLSGSASDVWIFQIAGNLSIASGGSVPAGIKVILAGGAQASNVFWQVGGGTGATLGTYSTFNGTILSAKQVIIQTGAVLNGRALAKTQVTLDANAVSAPVTSTTPPTSVQVHLFKYINGVKATSVNANGVNFPMFTSTYNAPFTLGPAGWTTGDLPYEASTSPMSLGSSYTAEENTTTALVGTSCDGAHTYALAGYSIGATLADAAAAAMSLNAPNFTGLQSDQYVIVWNRNCSLYGQISGMKYNDLNRNGKKDSGEPELPGWTIRLIGPHGNVVATTVTDANGNYSFLNLAHGKYKVREVHQNGWKRKSKNPKTITITAGSSVTNVDFGNAKKLNQEKEDTNYDDNCDTS